MANSDPKGWDKVCRDAVAEWLDAQMREFFEANWISFNDRKVPDLIADMLQAEHRDIFDAIYLKVPSDILRVHEADYLAKFSDKKSRHHHLCKVYRDSSLPDDNQTCISFCPCWCHPVVEVKS